MVTKFYTVPESMNPMDPVDSSSVKVLPSFLVFAALAPQHPAREKETTMMAAAHMIVFVVTSAAKLSPRQPTGERDRRYEWRILL